MMPEMLQQYLHTNHFAVAGACKVGQLSTQAVFSRREAVWQRMKPDASNCLLELWSRDDVSKSVGSTSSGDSDDSGGTDDTSEWITRVLTWRSFLV